MCQKGTPFSASHRLPASLAQRSSAKPARQKPFHASFIVLVAEIAHDELGSTVAEMSFWSSREALKLCPAAPKGTGAEQLGAGGRFAKSSNEAPPLSSGFQSPIYRSITLQTGGAGQLSF